MKNNIKKKKNKKMEQKTITHKFEHTFNVVDLLEEVSLMLEDEGIEREIDDEIIAMYTNEELNELARLYHLRKITAEFPDDENISDNAYQDLTDVEIDIHYEVLKRNGLITIDETKETDINNQKVYTSINEFKNSLKK